MLMHVPSSRRARAHIECVLLVRNDQNKISNVNNRVTESYTSKGKKRKEESEKARRKGKGERREMKEPPPYSISSRREDEGHLATVENEMETWISSERETKRSVQPRERERRNDKSKEHEGRGISRGSSTYSKSKSTAAARC